MIQDTDIVRADFDCFVLEFYIPFEESLHKMDDPCTFVGMVLARIQNWAGTAAGCLGRVDWHDGDRVLGIFDILRGEVLGQFQDFLRVPVIPVKVKGLVDRPARPP